LILTGEMDGSRLRQFKGTGCDACYGTGYASYDVIAECLEMNPALRDAILKGAGRIALKQLAKAAGTTTFLDSAWAFFRSGLTTLDEVKRIAAETK
jgi:type II secretory ATPase GspE/PulE/Tfp pilus assembly ATPase PilB-like protein